MRITREPPAFGKCEKCGAALTEAEYLELCELESLSYRLCRRCLQKVLDWVYAKGPN